MKMERMYRSLPQQAFHQSPAAAGMGGGGTRKRNLLAQADQPREENRETNR
jgi:hypothetical protein